MQRTDIQSAEGIRASSSGGCSVRVSSWRIQPGCCQEARCQGRTSYALPKVPAEESRDFTKAFGTKNSVCLWHKPLPKSFFRGNEKSHYSAEASLYTNYRLNLVPMDTDPVREEYDLLFTMKSGLQ